MKKIFLLLTLATCLAMQGQAGINVNPLMPQWDSTSMFIVNGQMTLWDTPDMTGNTNAEFMVKDAITGKVGVSPLIASGAISVQTFEGAFMGVTQIPMVQGSYPNTSNNVQIFDTYTVNIPANSRGELYYYCRVPAYTNTPNINGANPEVTGRIGITVLIDGVDPGVHVFDWKENIPIRTGVSDGSNNTDLFSLKQVLVSQQTEFDNIGGAAYSFTVQVLAFVEVGLVVPDSNIMHQYDWPTDVNQGETRCYIKRTIYL